MAHNSESKLKENIELHSLDLRKEKYYIQGWISLPIKSFFFFWGGGGMVQGRLNACLVEVTDFYDATNPSAENRFY